ncbi:MULTISPECIES: LysR family transcriptional regulator [Pseudomonas]|jgi:Transcriptional regulator|uniref:Putative Transcriptional regulator, LysR family n=1 Tax=Pseudomonas brassicacearum (strain NFM421) TaxID=994484 RepID=F2KGE0_PSEBN|nr:MULTISPECIES: LysR family transcriptional regulator [Pseudomonas]EIK64918.1 transcriptional regulator, LysR family [Pseudomonas fluorescens Q8r1-96]KIR18087.1 HTH-type transcriptional regulator GbpR [Pseudomonas fluorescens]AEA69276.1 Putative Transcriptional regulator, LysR family [Pseudomonas brassicacearum subsp. brassicacearum NFM421]ALQ03829.1 Chromosome initiation inhibitor [Pseudomonas brassicacearum]AOS37439.1 LysR family transcriptional regulator [Pseudomonas brassicacearum]
MTHPVLSRSLFNRLRYKHLHMLVALSASQNLHRASQSLNMSQPAATRMLHEIEDMFGCDLFERLPRGMRPTALGQELIRFAELALSGLDRCAEDLLARQQGGYGYLSIGTIMGAAPDLVMDSIARIKALNPQLRIRIMGDTSDQVIQLLEQGRIDLAIARRNAATDSEHYEFEQLGNERLLVVVHAGHPLARRKKLALAELVSDWPWILQPETSPARIGLDQALQRLALPTPADIIECSSVYSMQQLIQLTDAIMVLSETALRDYLKMGLVVALPVALDVQLAPFGLLRRKGEPVSRELGLFIDLLRSKANGRAGD